MTQPKGPKAIADDISTEKAWKIGRRIYVRCSYQSQLNEQLRDIGASWDRDVRALWVGSTKLAQVLPLLRAQAERVAKVSGIKAAGRWVIIPYEATNIREAAKRLGGVWDGDRKAWAMPTDDAHEQIQTLLTARDEAVEAAKRAAEQEREEARQRAEQEQITTAEARKRRIIEASGRHVVSEAPIYVTGHLEGYLRRPQAEQAKPQPGQIRRWKGCRRVLVVDCDVEFASQDAIDDGMSYAQLWDSPGWYWRYEAIEVEPTPDEVDADHESALWVDDYRTIKLVMRDAEKAADLHAPEPGEWPRSSRTIAKEGRGSGVSSFGKIVVTDGGEYWWTHPGYYDDYRAVVGLISDEAVIARIKAVLAGGTRRLPASLEAGGTLVVTA